LLAVDQHAVEAAVAIRLAGQVMSRRENDAPAFASGDAGGGATEIGAAAQAHLDENQRPASAADQVDLAATDAEIALDDAQAAAFQMACRPFLGFAAARRGGIVGLCLHGRK